jgi:hypothetical protein
LVCDRGYLCFDKRTELEKVADRQEAADRKNGRCLYSHKSNIFRCSRTSFVCVDQVLCGVRTTEEQNKEDEDKGARAKRKKYVRDAAIGGTFEGMLGISTLCCYCCYCGSGGRKKKSETDAERARTRRERDLQRARTQREGCTEGVKAGR